KDPVSGHSVERLSTYNGHTAAVRWDTRNVLTGSAENNCRLWDCVKRKCMLDFTGNIIMFSTDKQMGCQGFMNFIDPREPQIDSIFCRACDNEEHFCCLFVSILEKKAEKHSRHINDIQTSVDLTMFISVSKDNTAKLFDSAFLDHSKTFKTERPGKSAVVMGGGQEAIEVTTTFTRIARFEARFFHAVYEEEFGEDGHVRWRPKVLVPHYS
uniref:Serine-threonine kinase receptor-associated protein n=1 Tax=Cynoglossus semilaevis TaxID=244447 RepID=A0A3P8WAP9_CYNSE